MDMNDIVILAQQAQQEQNGKPQKYAPLPLEEAQIAELELISRQLADEAHRRFKLPAERDAPFMKLERVKYLHRAGGMPTFPPGEVLVILFWRMLTDSRIDDIWREKAAEETNWLRYDPNPDCLIAYLSPGGPLVFAAADSSLLQLAPY